MIPHKSKGFSHRSVKSPVMQTFAHLGCPIDQFRYIKIQPWLNATSGQFIYEKLSCLGMIMIWNFFIGLHGEETWHRRVPCWCGNLIQAWITAEKRFSLKDGSLSQLKDKIKLNLVEVSMNENELTMNEKFQYHRRPLAVMKFLVHC